ncbi:hypothetical protein METHP14_130040 [Pseudomonas sp. P14-2025]
MPGICALPVPALSRVNPLLRGGRAILETCAAPVGAGLPAKGPVQATPDLFDPRLAAVHQDFPAPLAQVSPPLVHQLVPLRGKREVALRARAAVDVAGHCAPLHVIVVATIGRQFIHPAHDQLPLFTMGLDAVAKQLVGNQVCHFMGHGLAQEVFLVFAVELQVEAQQILVQVGDAGFLPAQFEADFGAREAAFEKGFGLLVTGFDALFELLGHGGAVLLTRHYAASAGGLPSHRSAHSQRPPCGGPWLMPQCWFGLF